MANEHPANTSQPAQSAAVKPKEPSPIRRYFLYVLIGGLVVSALISIIAVLVGEFNETVGKALLTTLMIVIHALIGLAFLSTKSDQSLSSKLIVNTLFGVVVASLLTSILGIWDVFDSVIIGDLYLTYFFGIITVLTIAALLTSHQQDQATRALSLGSISSVVVTYLLILPYIFADDNYTLPNVYVRVTWAFVILSATLVVLTCIFDRLFVVKHPEVKASDQAKPGSMPTWLKILLICIGLLFVLPLIWPILAFLIGITFIGF